MSLAGRFFPSTMRMDSELRLAIADPRRGVLARGNRVQPAAGGRAGAALGARGAGRAGLGRQARGRGNRFHFIHPPPPPHVWGTLRPGKPIAIWGSPRWAGSARAAALIGLLEG